MESRVTPSGTQIWTAEGGGRIRTSLGNNQNWVFQDTPEDVQQTLLDIWFEPGSSTRGWAAGRAGHLLRTVDGGNTWEHFDSNQHEIPDSTGNPANISTIWKTRWVDTDGEGDPDLGFIAGMYTFKRNELGSAHDASDFEDVKLWTDLTAVNTTAMIGDLEPQHFEFYSMAIARDSAESDDWIGFVAGDFWPSPNTHQNRTNGFYTDTRLAQSENGRNWWRVFDADLQMDNSSGSPVRMVDAWETEFEAESAPFPSNASQPVPIQGFMVGGNGNNHGFVYRTDNGGQTWDLESFDFSPSPPPTNGAPAPTLYGVSSLGNGKAIACGYGGSIWKRNTVTGLWDYSPIPGISSPLACSEASTGARNFVGGSFGVLRGTVNGGSTWPLYLNPGYLICNTEDNWRIHDLHFVDETTGYAVGQFQLIAKTTDGGLSYEVQNGSPGNVTTPAQAITGIAFRDADNGVTITRNPVNSTSIVPWSLYTNDGGVNWTKGVVHPDPNSGPSGPTLAALTDVEYSGQFNVYWASGNRSDGSGVSLYTSDGGMNWYFVAGPIGSVRLESMAFVGFNQGFAAGSQGKNARVYRLDFVTATGGGGTYQWVDVSPDQPLGTQPARRLNAIDARGTDYATCEALAVGQNGCVFQYEHAMNKFVAVPGVYDLDGSGAVTHSLLDQSLLSISMAPLPNSSILIGAESLAFEHTTNPWKRQALQTGAVLRYDGLSWSTQRCGTDKDHIAVQLVDGDTGYLLGNNNGKPNSELGAVGDYLILRYQEKP